MNDEFEQPIDKIIREAREKGAFDDMAGKGRPIQWADDSMVPEDQRMANQVLRNAGFAPDWVLERRELEQNYQSALRSLNLARAARADGRMDEPAWQSALEGYTQAITALNRRILRYNFHAPAEQLQLPMYPTNPPDQS